MAKIDSAALERFLFNEMTEAEREKFEEEMFADDELFYAVAEKENDLVDRYVRNELPGALRERFERSFALVPSRREKIANAAALRTFITAESARNAEAAAEGIWERFVSLFRVPSVGLAMGGLVVLLSVLSIGLWLQNKENREMIAELRANRAHPETNAGRGEQLEHELSAIRANENALRSRIDREIGVVGDLTADLEKERTARRQLEEKLSGLRDTPANGVSTPTAASVETLTLKPSGPGVETGTLSVGQTAKRVSVLLDLPEGVGNEQRFSIRLNGKQIASDLPVLGDEKRKKKISVTVDEAALRAGENKFEAFDAAGNKVIEYVFSAKR